MTRTPCSSCQIRLSVVAMLSSPRGHYQLCSCCLGSDATPPPEPIGPEAIADRKASAAAVADMLAWIAAADRRAAAQGEHLDQRGAA